MPVGAIRAKRRTESTTEPRFPYDQNMSYELAFWAGGDDLDPRWTYLNLEGTDTISGVHEIDKQAVERALDDQLPDWTRDANMLQPPGATDANGPGFDVSIGRQLISFTGYGVSNDNLNAIIDLMVSLGFRLYDPQVRERFA